ncbi:S-layer homology domain-containing protein [Halalkalibacterium ligniniphilum]|uniref:S-layer homology domain-containing protein n=1 Tax=Halalkalibacterium ligniniphilum TaxID=1134413 RepID=UPI00034C06C4|nr:S-layer homology domain-containing protein [Halalkalibacterium ligniniphilum]
MKRLKSQLSFVALGLGVLLLSACSTDADASNVTEIASDDYVDKELRTVQQKAASVEARAEKLEQEVQALLGGDRKPSPAPGVFTDVRADFYAHDEIVFLSDRGVIRGYPDGSFKPNQTITRAQTASMLVRELGLDVPDDYELKATDVSANHPNYNDLRRVEYHGIMSGNNGEMSPGAGLRRSQMAIILAKAFKLAPPSEQYSFTDIGPDYPNFEQINTIAHYGITTEVGKAFRPNETTNRAQFSLFLTRAINLNH